MVSDTTTTMASLMRIQQRLKAPKNQRNNFGNYNYRSCEDILEAVKPLLEQEDATLLLSDELVQVGDRYYVKATAGFVQGDNKVETTAFAREAETKKGMDESQITGTASSYARKYALNGLFLIDDTKDADTDEYRKNTTQRVQNIEVKASNKISFQEVRERLSEIVSVDDLNRYWTELHLTDKQANILKKDFADRKAKLGAGE
jgi:hypothetical protein